MTVSVKICGVTTPEAAVAASRAAMIGFVFYPRSPRFLRGPQAGDLISRTPPGPHRVGLFVDSDDAIIESILEYADLDFLQLHGEESPQRVQAIKQRFAKPVIKAITLRVVSDLDAATGYFDSADWLLFDASPPTGALRPGGNATAFDWRILDNRHWPLPWLLAGGLDADNLARAVNMTGARVVDVSSGVEERPGYKSPEKIKQFLDKAADL